MVRPNELLDALQEDEELPDGPPDGDGASSAGDSTGAAARRARWDELAARVAEQNQRARLSVGPRAKKSEAECQIKYGEGVAPEVTNLQEMFRWPIDYQKAADASFGLNDQLRKANAEDNLHACVYAGTGPAMTRFVHNMTYTSVGLGWAGVDAPGTAMSMISAQLLQFFKEKSPDSSARFCKQEDNYFKPVVKYAVEIDADNRAELRLHPRSPQCLFGDYEDFWKVEIKATINRLKQQNQKVSWIAIPHYWAFCIT